MKNDDLENCQILLETELFDREVFMGKKKRQKTKELSVAIAEASSKGGDNEHHHQQQQQPQPTRKRGRPRKVVVVETESEGKKVEAEASAATEKEKEEEEEDDEQHVKPEEELLTSASARTCRMIVTKEEGVFEGIQLPKGEPSRSRARRKSKPRKST